MKPWTITHHESKWELQKYRFKTGSQAAVGLSSPSCCRHTGESNWPSDFVLQMSGKLLNNLSYKNNISASSLGRKLRERSLITVSYLAPSKHRFYVIVWLCMCVCLLPLHSWWPRSVPSGPWRSPSPGPGCRWSPSRCCPARCWSPGCEGCNLQETALQASWDCNPQDSD